MQMGHRADKFDAWRLGLKHIFAGDMCYENQWILIKSLAQFRVFHLNMRGWKYTYHINAPHNYDRLQ